MSANPNDYPTGAEDWETQWRCPSCQALLGLRCEDGLYLKYKRAEYVAKGPVWAVCRRCGTPSSATPLTVLYEG